MHYKSARVNTVNTPIYRVMYDTKSQDGTSWRIGLVLFAITKSWRISQSTLRSLGLIAFQLKRDHDKIANHKMPVFCPENNVYLLTCCIYSSAL